MKRILTLMAMGVCFAACAADNFSLSGQWRFELDRADAGEKERWFARELAGAIQLPGTLPGQGIGDPVTVDTKWIGSIVDKSWFTEPQFAKYREPGNAKVPFWLTPETYYAGAAWYQREIEIPQDWQGKRVVLSLERPHWETRVWVDTQLVGTNNSLATPHEYELGQLAPGKHTLTIRVDNRMIVDIGENSHSISDHTQGNWNGIVGKIELRATPLVWIEDLQVYPDPWNASIRVVGQIGNMTGKSGSGTIRFGQVTNTVDWDTNGCTFEIVGMWGGVAMKEWSEFQPALFDATIVLSGEGIQDEKTVRFGFRNISTDGTQFTINGRKTFFRGTLDCCIYPKTGHPPTDVESWKRVINICKAHGLNMIRFHSWCPPEAAFVAADELGFYLQVEASSWANQSTTLGDGKPVDDWVYAETDRILKFYGNHPSFVLMPYGNEPGGKNYSSYLAKWVEHYKARDPRRLWTSGAGWPQIPENEFHVTPDPRIQGWGQGLKSRINAKPPETTTDYRDYIQQRGVPVISHEIGQWCVYPNFDEIEKYTGYLKPRNFEIFRDSLNEHHLGDLAHQFLLASGKLQTLCYKEDIESALRTPGMGGFQLLDLHDFPGQGTALVGVLDPFWESKGYVTPEEYSRFCNSTVPLARLSKRAFATDEKLEATVEVAHFGAAPFENAVTEWKLVDGAGKVFANGKLPVRNIPLDNAIPLGEVEFDLKKLPAPAKYKLVASVAAGNRRFENDWDIWVYPPKVDTSVPREIAVVDELNDVAIEKLNAGGKVLLMISPRRVTPDEKRGRVALGFSSIFWNTAWTAGQAPHTLGLLVNPDHPLFERFPTEFHSNWQWWYLVSRAGAMILDDLPQQIRPTVQVIDDWVTNRKLGLLFEAKLGSGKLVVCSIDLERDLESDPVRRQFRHSLLRYMSGAEFNPTHEVTVEQVRGLMAKPSLAQKRGIINVQADSEETQHEAERAFDGDPKTIWHTPWRSEPTGFPHYLEMQCKTNKRVSGFKALPRQDGIRNGWICDYAFYASDDGKNWGEPVKRGTFPATKDLKTVRFEKPVSGKYFMLVALAGFSGQYASLAEFELIEDEPAQTTTPEKRFSLVIDGSSPGLIFDGVGAVSSGGSSRLLIDYPERERNEILDYLFKTNYGAGLQILKVEIGADTDATCGAEPSHQRTPDKIQNDLGYEWWLMNEAFKRNPEIKLYGLAWGAPGWIGQSGKERGSVSSSAQGGAASRSEFWSDDNIRYTISWLDCAKQNGFRIDYLGGGNERGWDADYYIKLRKALNEHGYAHVKIVATDDHNPPDYWRVASEMKTNRVFADAVDILGQHDVCVWRTQQRNCYVSADALALGKPLWDSENSTQDYAIGFEPLARAMNRHYIEGRVTANLNWSLVGAYYGSFPAPGTGLLLADRPWSGWYGIGKSVWVNAHTTQFVKPGWRYLDSACGYTPGGASYVSLRAPKGDDYSIVIETLDLSGTEILDLTITDGLSHEKVYLWKTDLRSENEKNHFVKIDTIKPRDGKFRVTIEPGCLYTLSTTSGQRKGTARPKTSPGERMPLPLSEDFENVGSHRLARYFSDVHGGFETVPSGGGRSGKSYRQMIPQEPILWHGAKMPPTTIFGDPLWWGDYEISADAMLEGPGYVELLGRIEAQQHNALGYHFQVSDTGAWTLFTQDKLGASLYPQDEQGRNRTLASGNNATFGVGQWRRLAMRFEGDQISVSLDGKKLATVRDESHTSGQVGLRVSAWQHAQFDNVRVEKTADWPEFIPNAEITATATSEYAENDFGSIHIAQNAIDERVETSWRSRYAPRAPLPQAITLELKRVRTVAGLVYKPELAGTGRGVITSYNVYLSDDGKTFNKVAGGHWPASIASKSASWKPQRARFVRLEATAVSGDLRKGAAIAEIQLSATPLDEPARVSAKR